jgi:HD-GYP domain-containing protein (c-di-GMP phosphodiesterase class II)
VPVLFSLRIDQVKSGMTLAHPVFNMNGTRLLEKDVILDQKLIDRLKNGGAKRVWVTDEGAVFLMDSGPQKIYYEAVKALQDMETEVLAKRSFDPYVINTIAYELVEQIIYNEIPFAEIVRMKVTETTIVEHMVDVALLSVITAKALGMDKLEMRFLAFAALVHDVGKLLVPREILAKPGKLSEAEMKLIIKHPQVGVDILGGIEGVNKHALNVTLQHHERLDGTGYPFGLKDKHIQPFSKLVAIADVYTAVIKEKAYRPRLFVYEAGEFLWNQAGMKLDRKLTAAFLRHVANCPLRSIVKLNNDIVGKVVYQNNDFPCRPIISVDGELIDLSETSALFVTEIVAYEYD